MSEPMSDERLAEMRRWARIHRDNQFQREGAKRVAELVGEVERLRAAPARVKALHYPHTYGNGRTVCGHCNTLWPCATIRALEGATDAGNREGTDQ